MPKAFTNKISLADIEAEAQNLEGGREAVAQLYNFHTWKQLAFFARSRDLEDALEPKTREEKFQFLACLVYFHFDTPERRKQAGEMLAQNPGLAKADIHSACCAGDVDAVRDFLDADPGLLDRRGGVFDWEPLLYACYSRLHETGAPSTLEVARLLIERGANPNAHYMWGGQYRFTAVTGAFGEGECGPLNHSPHPDRETLARLLLEAGADPNDSQALYNCMFEPGTQCVKLLVEFGLNADHKCNWLDCDENGELQPLPDQTLAYQLSWALENAHPERARLLTEAGADVTIVEDGKTFYECAMRAGEPEIAELLVERGAERVKLQPADALLAACMAGDTGRAREFLAENPGLLDESVEASGSMLKDAAGANRLDAVRALLDIGFDVNRKGQVSPLHEAAWRGHVDMLRLLVERGADVSVRDSYEGGTPVGWAYHGKQKEALEFLAGCEIDLFDCIRVRRHERLEALLEQNKALLETTMGDLRGKSDVEDSPACIDWRTPLAQAVLLGNPDAVRLLLEKGADPEVCDPDGRSIRTIAVETSDEIGKAFG